MESFDHATIEMHEGEPTFEEIAPEIRAALESANCLMGYNVGFDINMLQAEFERVDADPLDLTGVSIIDPLAIWMNQERRRLVDAYKEFVGRPLEGANDSRADTIATARVYNKMLNRFDLFDRNARELDSMFRRGQVGIGGKFKWGGNGRVLFNFGMHKLRPVLDQDQDLRSYLEWMLGQDFSRETCRIATLALELWEDEVEFNERVAAEFGGPNL